MGYLLYSLFTLVLRGGGRGVGLSPAPHPPSPPSPQRGTLGLGRLYFWGVICVYGCVYEPLCKKRLGKGN